MFVYSFKSQNTYQTSELRVTLLSAAAYLVLFAFPFHLSIACMLVMLDLCWLHFFYFRALDCLERFHDCCRY